MISRDVTFQEKELSYLTRESTSSQVEVELTGDENGGDSQEKIIEITSPDPELAAKTPPKRNIAT